MIHRPTNRGAESLMRSWWLIRKLRYSLHVMEAEESLWHSQEPVSGPCLGPDQSTLNPGYGSHKWLFLDIHFSLFWASMMKYTVQNLC